MELQCFGGGRCPDWVLAGLFACTKFDAEDAKSVCLAIAAHAAGESLDDEELKAILSKYDMDTLEHTNQVLASVLYVLHTCARWDSDSAQLAAGMRTIRISNHMIRALRAAFEEHGSGVASAMRKKSLILTKLHEASVVQAPEATVECVQLEMVLEDVVNSKKNDYKVLIQKEDLAELVSELKRAKKYME